MISFTVYGVPQTAGSKRAFVIARKGVDVRSARDCRAIVTDDNEKGKPWRADIQAAAIKAMGDTGDDVLLKGPVMMHAVFFFPRPASHYGSGKNAGKIKSSAPLHHTVKPDRTKCLRFLEDALTQVVWRDDSQVVDGIVSKRYCDDAHPRPCVEVEIWEVAK